MALESLQSILSRHHTLPVVVLHWKTRRIWLLSKHDTLSGRVWGYCPGYIHEKLDQELDPAPAIWVYKS